MIILNCTLIAVNAIDYPLSVFLVATQGGVESFFLYSQLSLNVLCSVRRS